ncbi:hypothetical protein QQZ08_011285 [Neonectria magnoliae]|uniref:BTB domain-containing protein n=1 Tax=Neonectria magnoliae TaxID=2732573 RepID=A0ABR1HBP0_9HYPO
MAPGNGNASANTRRHRGSKLAQPPKPVTPAIPLPYVKRQAAAAAAATASVNPPRPETKNTNGAATAKAKKDTKAPAAASADAAPAVKPAKTSRPENGPETTNGAVKANHQHSSAASISEQASTASELSDAPKVTTAATTTSDHLDQPTASPKATARAQAPDHRSPKDIPQKPNGVASKGEMKPHQAEATRSGEGRTFVPTTTDHPTAKHPTKARPPPAIDPSRYQMPPSFQPVNRPLGLAANGDMSRAPRGPNAPHVHQPHPSNGSIHFGTFHGSTNSSPAPPLSGGFAPPPGMAGQEGRPPYMGHANGFPPMMPYGGDVTFDSYGRPSMAYGPMDSYPPYGNFGPSTPHSFHDSQTSGHPEDNGMFNQYQPGPRNGVNGLGDDSPNHPGRMFGGPEYPRMPNHGPTPHINPPLDEADGLIGHLQQQFGVPDFSDCILELRYEDNRAPVRIPGHKILLSRSSEVASILAKQTSQSSVPTILLETKSKWIRSDSFYIAVQRLYGLPLFSIPPPPAGVQQSDVADAGSAIERLDFALSYAAAGQLLNWEPVTRRGCEIAIQLINWQTMERTLEFALEEHLDKASYDAYKYGEGSRAILNGIVTYIITNLPPNFVLDTSVESKQFRRLPLIPVSTPPTAVATPGPAIARGTSLHLGRVRHSQHITGIQFGDLSMPAGKNPATEHQVSRPAYLPSHAVLSRVLLNIPFAHLKMALEPGTHNANGWNNAEHRYYIVRDVVAERERRRLQAVDAVRGGRIPGWEAILKQLSTPEPRYFDQWSALGWKEEISQSGNPEGGPTLGRTWVPLMEPQNGTVAEYP